MYAVLCHAHNPTHPTRSARRQGLPIQTDHKSVAVGETDRANHTKMLANKRLKTEDTTDPGDGAEPLEEGISALDAIRIKLVGDPSQIDSEPGVAPEFAHQIFEGERLLLLGDDRALKMEVLYNESDLRLFIRPSGTPIVGAAKEVVTNLISQMPPPCASIDEFKSGLSSPAISPSVLSGEQIGDYERDGAKFEVRCGALGHSPERSAFVHRLQVCSPACFPPGRALH